MPRRDHVPKHVAGFVGVKLYVAPTICSGLMCGGVVGRPCCRNGYVHYVLFSSFFLNRTPYRISRMLMVAN